MKERSVEYEQKFRAYLFSMDIRYYCEKCMKNINNEVD